MICWYNAGTYSCMLHYYDAVCIIMWFLAVTLNLNQTDNLVAVITLVIVNYNALYILSIIFKLKVEESLDFTDPT